MATRSVSENSNMKFEFAVQDAIKTPNLKPPQPETLSNDDDVYYYIRWRLKLEGETENMCVCTKERKGVTAAVLMATPCTNSLSR